MQFTFDAKPPIPRTRASEFSGCPSSSSSRLDAYGTIVLLQVDQIELEVSHAGFLNESPQISKDHCSDESSHCIRDGVREVPQKLVQAEKTEPSWHIIDKDELASMVTQKSVEHVENCDLPQPLTKDFRKGQLPSLELPGYCETLPPSLDWPIQEVFSDLSNHHWGRSTSVKCR
ncbi:hypothetical protein QUC31_008328 [Theobroma cacao]